MAASERTTGDRETTRTRTGDPPCAIDPDHTRAQVREVFPGKWMNLGFDLLGCDLESIFAHQFTKSARCDNVSLARIQTSRTEPCGSQRQRPAPKLEDVSLSS